MELEARAVTLPLAETFVISRDSSDESESVFVELRHGGAIGFGEGAPIERYQEDASSAAEFLNECADLLGDDPFAFDEIHGRLPATAHTQAARAALDVERVRAVRSVTELPLQVDVNEYWTVDEALDALQQLARLGVEYCEQPLPEGDESGATLKARSPIPIYVDEDCHTLADVAGCAERAHGINIKLSKSGGIREAIRMADAARALGLGVMVGCMTESGLGISAGAQIASLCDFVDLDGNLLLAEDPWPGVELVDGVQLPPDRPGLGASPLGVGHRDESAAAT